MKKDFKAANTGRVYDTIAEATAEDSPIEKGNQQGTTEPEGLTFQKQRAAAPTETPALLPPDPPELARRSRGKEPTLTEIAVAQAMGRTQGRKGCRATRVNMAFAPDIMLYIRTMSRVQGQTITQFTNEVFADSMNRNKDLYQKAREIMKQFDKGDSEE